MAGGLMRIVSYGKKNLALTRKPKITPFKKVYRASIKSIPRGLRSKNNNAAAPFPAMKLYHLRYAQQNVMSAGLSGIYGSNQAFNLNSVYDPDSTGVGHQPYGFDALALAYHKYKVVGATVRLDYTDPTQDGLCVGTLITNPTNSTTNLTGQNTDAFREKQNSTMTPVNDSGSQVKTKIFKLSMAKLANLSKLQFKADVDDYNALVTANPLHQIQLKVAVADLRGGSTGSVIVNTKITYHVLFYQRKIMAVS